MFYFSSNYRKRDLEIGSYSWLQRLSKQGAVKLEGNLTVTSGALWQFDFLKCKFRLHYPKNIDLDLWTHTNLTKKNHPINYSNKYRQKRQ